MGFINKIIAINRYICPFLVGLAFMLSGIETYTYIGFIRKFVFVDSRFFLVLAVISSALVIDKKLNLISVMVFKINCVFLPVLLTVYVLMQTLEASHFHNYVFSTYHLQPENFFYMVILSGSLYILNKFGKKIYGVDSILMLGIFSVLIYIFTVNLNLSFNQAIYSDLYIAFHPKATYDQKMHDYWGFVYDYITFVKNNTPENSTIMIPPQEAPWFTTGNEAIVQYFLYPRNLVQGTLDKSLDIKSVDYVLLAWGEWTDSDASKYGWPKVKINTEKVIYFNGDKKWGIIKVKK
jgi:hypothetical protein